jgi:hypothetical protein
MAQEIAEAGREDLIKKLAWEVARNVIDHHRFVYSAIFAAAPSTFPISIRNSIFNQISSAIECKTDDQIREWIANSEAHRKTMRAIKRMRKP